VDELLFHNDTVSLCLLVNRRHQTLRVIDFRAGPTLAKRNFVIAAAKREGVEKVFTLVERDEVSTWTRLGFSREGSIHAFYKRSDAWILAAAVSPRRPRSGGAPRRGGGRRAGAGAPGRLPGRAHAGARAAAAQGGGPRPARRQARARPRGRRQARRGGRAAQRPGPHRLRGLRARR